MVKLVVTETRTYSGTNAVGEEAEVPIREARGVNRGLGLLVTGLVAKAEELRGLQYKYEPEDIAEAYEEAKEEMPPGSPADRSIYIDFSNNIPESQIDKIISLESEWWGVTLTKERYAESGKWGAQWVFVVDGTDWRTFMKNLEASRGKKITETHRGYHVGEGYPYEEGGKETTYRGYSYINWGQCLNAAEVALYYKEKKNKEHLKAAKETGGSWAFLEDDPSYDAVYNDKYGIWDYAPEKIAAWIINHELCHGIYRTGDDKVLPFDGSIQPLEILTYYTEVGVEYLGKKLGANEERDPNKFLDFTGGKRIKRKRK